MQDSVPLSAVLAVIGIVISVLLAVASATVVMLLVGVALGVLGAPWVRRAAAWLARHLER